MDIRATMPYLPLLWPLSPSPHIPKVGPSEPTSNLENCPSRGGRAWPDSTPTPQELWDGPLPPPHPAAVHNAPERGTLSSVGVGPQVAWRSASVPLPHALPPPHPRCAGLDPELAPQACAGATSKSRGRPGGALLSPALNSARLHQARGSEFTDFSERARPLFLECPRA